VDNNTAMFMHVFKGMLCSCLPDVMLILFICRRNGHMNPSVLIRIRMGTYLPEVHRI